MQGGPGASSMFGVLKEHGPFLADLDVDGKPFVKENPYTWAGNHSVLYVDNPIGTGFSFTDDPDDFPSFVEETTEVIISYFVQNRGRTKDFLPRTCMVFLLFLSELELRKNLGLFPQDLYDLLQQFFILFPDLANNPFFAMGESYGGKWVLMKCMITWE